MSEVDLTKSETVKIKEEKKNLRALVRKKNAALDKGYTRAASEEICARLLALDAYQAADTVFCFVGMATEIDTRSFLTQALSDGKVLCVPLCGKNGQMSARRITALNQLVPGMLQIPEPPDTAPEVSPEEIDLCVTPCLAADSKRHRLGQGGGYYDRFLPQLSPRAVSALVCRQQLLVPAVPTEPHDVACTLLITENR